MGWGGVEWSGVVVRWSGVEWGDNLVYFLIVPSFCDVVCVLSSEYHPARALHFLALITAPLSTEMREANGLETGTGVGEKRVTSPESGGHNKKQKLSLSSEDRSSPGPQTCWAAAEETLQWVREVVERDFSVLSRNEQEVLGNAHNKVTAAVMSAVLSCG